MMTAKAVAIPVAMSVPLAEVAAPVMAGENDVTEHLRRSQKHAWMHDRHRQQEEQSERQEDCQSQQCAGD